MPKLTASYTVLSQWYQGKKDDAIKSYFHLPRETTPEMSEGKRYHQGWSGEIKQYGVLPLVFGGRPLKNPLTDKFLKMDISPNIELIGYADLIDKPTLYEFKTGVSPANDYVGTYQGNVYGVLAHANGIKVDKCTICHYNQYTKSTDISSFWLTPKALKDGEEWVRCWAEDMYNELVSEGLFEQFQHYRDIYKANRSKQ